MKHINFIINKTKMIRTIIIISIFIYVSSIVNKRIIKNGNIRIKKIKDNHKKLPPDFLKNEAKVFNDIIKNNTLNKTRR